MTNIILCCGSRTRLWLISLTLMSKQFVKLNDSSSTKRVNIDLSNSILLGDNNRDIAAGVNAGIGKNYLISTGHYIAENIFDVLILDNLNKLKNRIEVHA